MPFAHCCPCIGPTAGGDNRNADLSFQVIRFAQWHTVFPSATCATALVERVVHHADIVKIEKLAANFLAMVQFAAILLRLA